MLGETILGVFAPYIVLFIIVVVIGVILYFYGGDILAWIGNTLSGQVLEPIQEAGRQAWEDVKRGGEITKKGLKYYKDGIVGGSIYYLDEGKNVVYDSKDQSVNYIGNVTGLW